jgi:hypothetical protein
LRPTYSRTANIWYSIYAVKVQDNSTDFVIVGDSATPTQANYSALNTAYGTNGWVYLGYIRNGDNSGATNSILKFYQSGAVTYFGNTATGNSNDGSGIRFATTASAGTLTYSASVGFTTTDIPDTVSQVYWGWSISGGSTTSQFKDSTNVVLLNVGIGTVANIGRLWYVIGTSVHNC